jgi:hypothetical protein
VDARQHAGTRLTASVCTGAHVRTAPTQPLDGRRAACCRRDHDDDAQGYVRLPARPLAARRVHHGQIANTSSATAKVFLVGLGGAQLAGAVMLYYGLTTTKTVFVRNDLVGSLKVGPLIGEHNTTGMVVSGRF